MNTDWFFNIGKSHTVCEDYAISGDEYAIVSDGCSSAKHTDLGARLLVHSARTLLNTDVEWNYNDLGKAAIAMAARLLDNIEMDRECLYATLVIAHLLPSGQISVKMYGDGIIIGICDDSITTIEASFTNNMPYYLAYEIDAKSLGLYKHYLNKLTLERSVNGQVVDTQRNAFDSPIEYVFDPELFSTVLISSDGLSSFEDTKLRQPLGLGAIAHMITRFKGMKGEFLKRRLNRVLNDLASGKIFPFDDVGVAAIHLREGDKPCLTAISKEEE